MIVATLEGNGRVTKRCPQSDSSWPLEQRTGDLVSNTLDTATRWN